MSLNAKFAGRKPVPSGFNFSLPGNLVMYLMMNLLIFGGATVAAERRNGVIKRLMVHPVTRLELVMGKIYGLMLLGVVQIVFFLAVGQISVSRQPRREPARRDADAARVRVGGRFAGRAGRFAGCRSMIG